MIFIIKLFDVKFSNQNSSIKWKNKDELFKITDVQGLITTFLSFAFIILNIFFIYFHLLLL